jgi:hypothetical protein
MLYCSLADSFYGVPLFRVVEGPGNCARFGAGAASVLGSLLTTHGDFGPGKTSLIDSFQLLHRLKFDLGTPCDSIHN